MKAARALGPVAWAELRGQRLQAGLIALTLAACGALLTIGLAAQAASGASFDRLWRATNGPDLWFYLDATKATIMQIDDAMDGAPGVARWTGPIPQSPHVTPAGLPEEGFTSGFELRDWPTDPASLGKPLLVAGRAPRVEELGVIVVDRNLAATAHLSVGGWLSVPTPTGLQKLRIIGLEASAESCPYPLCSPQPLYVAPGGLAALGLMPGRLGGEYAVAVRATAHADAHLSGLRDEITARLPSGAVAFSFPISSTRQFSEFGFATQSGLLLVFSLAAAATAALLIVVAIGAAVRADSRRVGLLKAVGFSAGQLRAAALAQYVGLGVTGSLAGSTVGAALAPHLLSAVTDQFGTAPPRLPWADGLTAVAAVSLLTALVTLGAVRGAVRLTAVQALRADTGGSQGATPLLRGPLILARGVGDLLAGRGRSVLTAATIALAVGGLVVAALFASSMNLFLQTGLAFDGARSGDLLALGPNRLGDLAMLRAQPGVAAVVLEHNLSFSLPGSSQTLNLRVRTGDTAGLPEVLVAGRQLNRTGELVVGYGLAHSHHIQVGQDLAVLVGGTLKHFRVVGINREVDNLGQMATTLPQSVAGLATANTPPLYLIKPRADVDPAELARQIHTATGGLINPAVAGVGSLPPLIGSVIPVTRSLAAILALLTAIGVFNSVMLSVQERRREFGLIRALGMDQRQILGSGLTGVVLLAVGACIIAAPLAIIAGRAGLGAVMTQVGVGHLAPPLNAVVLGVAPLVVIVAVIAAVGPMWSASRTPVASVLRAD